MINSYLRMQIRFSAVHGCVLPILWLVFFFTSFFALSLHHLLSTHVDSLHSFCSAHNKITSGSGKETATFEWNMINTRKAQIYFQYCHPVFICPWFVCIFSSAAPLVFFFFFFISFPLTHSLSLPLSGTPISTLSQKWNAFQFFRILWLCHQSSPNCIMIPHISRQLNPSPLLFGIPKLTAYCSSHTNVV